MQKYLEPILNKMSKELGIPYKVCVDAYMAQWDFIQEKVKTFDFRNMTPEEFDSLRVNFNLPSIGKLCVTRERFDNLHRQLEYYRTHIKNVQNHENPSDVQRRDNDDEQV